MWRDWIEEEQILTADVMPTGERHPRSVHVEATAVPRCVEGDLLRWSSLIRADDLQTVNRPRHPDIGLTCFNHAIGRAEHPRADHPPGVGKFLPERCAGVIDAIIDAESLR